jgi:hypothetical protein
MANTLEKVRETLQQHISRSPKDKGWTLTVPITRYDNGLINVADIPMQADDYLSAARLIMQLLEEFRDECRRRQKAAA